MKTFFTRYRLIIYLILALFFITTSLFLSRWSDKMIAESAAIYFFGRHFQQTILFTIIALVMVLFALLSAMTNLFGLHDAHSFISSLFTLFGGEFI